MNGPYRYGAFGAEDCAFRIADPATPRAFDNFLWNEACFSCVQQTGVGFFDVQVDDREAVKLYTGIGRICDIETFGRDHLMSRLVYVRDNDTGEFWNVGWEPVCATYENFVCAHDLGCTTIASTVADITASMRIFIPPGADPVELWRISLVNECQRPRDLSVFVYNQYSLQYKWGFESYGDMIYRGTWYDEPHQALIVQKHPYVAPHPYLTGFLCADRRPDGFDGTRSSFVGDYNTLASPQSVVRGQCGNIPGSADSTIGALQFNLRLQPGQSEVLALANGIADSPDAGVRLGAQCLEDMDSLYEQVLREKNDRIARNRVTTPDAHFDRLVNAWLKQQALFGATWARWGYMGYRDIVQHGYGVSSFAPHRTRRILQEALTHQYSDGTAMRGWNPIDTKPYSDSALWLVFALTAYLKETGDFAFLEETVSYFDEGEATVAGHIDAALECLEKNKGAHGLCLIRFGDWNDSLTGIGKEGRGETVWLSMAYVYALELWAELREFLADPPAATECRRRAETMRQAIGDHAWDGEWFLRAFDDDGAAVGAGACEQGRIYLNAQSWALMSDVCSANRGESILASCDRLLATPLGYRLLSPPYAQRDDHIGRISYMEPGICENGTIYSHGNAFLMFALLRAGMPDRAYEVFRAAAPGYLEGPDSPKQNCPPYIFANCYYGPEHRNNPLQMEYTWITGSVAWFYNAVLDLMIGIRREYGGLTVDPRLPSDWPEAKIERTFRDRQFHVHIRRTGEKTVMLNGEKMAGTYIPLQDCADVNRIEATF